MIGAIEGTQGYSEPRLSSALAQATLRHVFDGSNDESASPWAAVSLAAALFVGCFHTRAEPYSHVLPDAPETSITAEKVVSLV